MSVPVQVRPRPPYIFYLINEDLYIEIKGYETSKDEAKWSQFSKKLKIIFGKELKYNYKLNIDL